MFGMRILSMAAALVLCAIIPSVVPVEAQRAPARSVAAPSLAGKIQTVLGPMDRPSWARP